MGSTITGDVFRGQSSTWTTVRRLSGSHSKQTISPRRARSAISLNRRIANIGGRCSPMATQRRRSPPIRWREPAPRPWGSHTSPPTRSRDILRRISSISDLRTPVAVETAVLGGIEQPKVKVSEAFDIFCNEIRAAELAGKSEKQREQWKKVKKLAVSSL